MVDQALYPLCVGVGKGWRRLRPEVVAQIKAMRADGYMAREIADEIGCSEDVVYSYVPGRIGKVPVAPLREAFLTSPVTAADIARELGWWCTVNRRYPCADSARVKRTLGLLPDINGAGKRSRRTLVDAETVQLIAEAIGVSPWAVLPDDESEAA